MSEENSKISVLVVDDSVLMRNLLTEVINSDPELEVVGTAEDAVEARKKIKELKPKVLSLDIEMPGMNGLEFLEKLMSLNPMPVVMLSTLTARGAEETIKALELGAFDAIEKPTTMVENNLNKMADQINRTLKAAAQSTPKPKTHATPEQLAAKSINLTPGLAARLAESNKIIAMGASTGGVEAIATILSVLPEGMPPIMITQHMPEVYIDAFVKLLSSRTTATVRRARPGEFFKHGHVYLAHSKAHLCVAHMPQGLTSRIMQGERITGHIPSVDAMFLSLSQAAPKQVIGVLLTGTGEDGARGMRKLYDAGADTIVQSKETCVVYNMPRFAVRLKGVKQQLDLDKIANAIVEKC